MVPDTGVRPMHISLIGSVGLGLVWGWLIGSLGGRVRRPLLDGLALGAGTLLLAGQVAMLAGLDALPRFFGAVMLALLLHLAWRRELRARLGPPM